MASAELSRRVEKVVGYPPLSEFGDLQRREFHSRGRELAEQEQGELVILGKDGRIREKNSHGHDPPDIPG
jgi:Uncharacterized protein conserved in bacteria (DUF2188)